MRFTTREIVTIIQVHGAKTLEEIKEYDRARGLSLKPIDYEKALNEAVEIKALKIEGEKYVYCYEENK